MRTTSFLAVPLLAPSYRVRTDTIAMCLYFLTGLADGALMPFFALWAQQEAQLPAKFIGFLLACYAGGELIATPLLGGVADRLGRRPVLLFSLSGVGIGFLLLSKLHGVWPIALCLTGIGIFECALHPTISAVIADVSAPDQLRMRYASARMASGVGHIAGPALGAGLALLSLNAVFVGCGLSLLCAALVIALILPETGMGAIDSGSSPSEAEEEGLAALMPIFRDRRLAALILWFTMIEILAGWTEVVIPLYAHGAHALSASGVGLLFTYAAAVAVALQWPITRFSTKFAAPTWVMGGGMALAGGFGLLLLQPDLFTLFASVALISSAQVLLGPLVLVSVNALAPASSRASYMAAVSTSNDLKDTVGPASGMFLYEVSARLPWLLGVPLALFAACALAMTIDRGNPPKSPGNRKAHLHGRSKPPLFVTYR